MGLTFINNSHIGTPRGWASRGIFPPLAFSKYFLKVVGIKNT